MFQKKEQETNKISVNGDKNADSTSNEVTKIWANHSVAQFPSQDTEGPTMFDSMPSQRSRCCSVREA